MKLATKLRFAMLAGVFTFAGVAASLAGASFGSSKGVLADDQATTEVDPKSFSITSTSITATDTTETFALTLTSIPPTYAYDNGSRYQNVYVEIDDPKFPGGKIEKVADDVPDDQIPVYNANVFHLQASKDGADIVIIPETLLRERWCKFVVTKINANVFDGDYDGVKTIYVPKTITTVEADAFKDIPNTITVKCEAESKPAGWDDNFAPSGANIEWNVSQDTLTKAQRNLLNGKSSSDKQFGTSANYIVGYFGEGALNLPLTASFNLLNADKTVAKQMSATLPLVTNNAIYDAVGDTWNTELRTQLNVEIEKDQRVDLDSIVFSNIYAAVKDGDKWVPDTTTNYTCKLTQKQEKIYGIDDFFSYSQGKVSTFSGSTQVDIKINSSRTVYESLNPTIYAQNKDAIADGTVVVRSLFYALNLAKFRVTYHAGNNVASNEIGLSSPLKFFQVASEGESTVGFIFEDSAVGSDYSADKLVKIELLNFTLRLDLYSPAQDAVLSRSNINTTFGAMTLYATAENQAAKVLNNNLVIILIAVIYIVLFAAGSVGFYFFAKEKYKNDEFRRVNKKKFIKQASVNGFGFGLITMAIGFIILRWGVMDTALVAFNPLDVYVIIFGVSALIFAGIAIKNLVLSVKEWKKRREAIRLRLDEDVVDDGTK